MSIVYESKSLKLANQRRKWKSMLKQVKGQKRERSLLACQGILDAEQLSRMKELKC